MVRLYELYRVKRLHAIATLLPLVDFALRPHRMQLIELSLLLVIEHDLHRVALGADVEGSVVADLSEGGVTMVLME